MIYYFIGIGGVGMSALAHFLLQKKEIVIGSDRQASAVTVGLQKAGATVYIGQRAENVPEKACVVYSSDIKPDHIERVRATELGLPIWHRSELLQTLMSDYKALMVAGTHGKTSTTGLLIHLLRSANLDPAYVVGGFSPSFPLNGAYGRGPYFVAEADESDGSFLRGSPYGGIVTNIDDDHLNYWGSFAQLERGFKQFCLQCDPYLIYSADDPHLASWELKGIPYGSQQIVDFAQKGAEIHFSFKTEARLYENMVLPQIGLHQALNALAVATLGEKIGLSVETIREAFRTFQGMKRRAELIGERAGVLYYDDYAHHPTEIKAILEALRGAFPDRRLIALFQPHRFSRFSELFTDFFSVFNVCDHVIVTDIYGAGEENITGISAQDLMAHLLMSSQYCAKNQLFSFLDLFLKSNDILVTLGAGDITAIGRAHCVNACATA